jgi:hypothetical protein
MNKTNDRQKILRAIDRAGFRLVTSKFINKEYTLVSKDELLFPYERKVK